MSHPKPASEKMRRMGLWLIALIALVAAISWAGGRYGLFGTTALPTPRFQENGGEIK